VVGATVAMVSAMDKHLSMWKGKVKQSLYGLERSWGLQEVEAPGGWGSSRLRLQEVETPGGWSSQFSRQQSNKGGKVSPTHWPPLSPRKYSWHSSLLGWVHTCNVIAHRNTVSWQCGRDSWPRNQLLIRYAVTSPVHTVTILCYDTR
jgi:hypothetical protein